MGGKSRKSGGVSRKLIAHIKSGKLTAGNKPKQTPANETTKKGLGLLSEPRPATEDQA
jgi:hypothetical protein